MATSKILLRDYVGRQVTLKQEVQTVGGEIFAVGARMEVISSHRGRFELWAVPYQRVNGGMVGIRRVSPEKVELVPVEHEIETGPQPKV